ncbi:putative serine/threonine-protein kinase iks1 [Savitreella phatthalungensis]
MALLIRRPSDWSVVLQNDGTQVRFDRHNNRLSFSQRPRSQASASTSSVTDRSTDTSIQEQCLGRCPTCGQFWPDESPEPSFSQTSAFHRSRRGTAVHPEYFGYLAACFERENVIESEPDTIDDCAGYTQLQETSFNQGYCSRFFVEQGQIGRGGRGTVFRVQHVIEGISLGIFALKRIAVGNSTQYLTKMLREVKSMRFHHPNLVHYNHVWLEMSQTTAFGPPVPVLHILQEFCDAGDLERYVSKKLGRFKPEPDISEMKRRRRESREHKTPLPTERSLSPDIIYSFFRDILNGLAYLHKRGHIHRDLKPSNCLLDESVGSSYVKKAVRCPRVLVSDFGEMASCSEVDASQDASRYTGGTGTLLWTAPEVVRTGSWSQAADIFSLGLILYFLTHAGQLPYNALEDNYEELKVEIAGFTGFHRLDSGRGPYERKIDLLLSRMLSPSPSDRPTCEDLIALMQIQDESVSGNESGQSSAAPAVVHSGPPNDELSVLEEPFRIPSITPEVDQAPVEQSLRTTVAKQASETEDRGKTDAITVGPLSSSAQPHPVVVSHDWISTIALLRLYMMHQWCNPQALSPIAWLLLALTSLTELMLVRRFHQSTQIRLLLPFIVTVAMMLLFRRSATLPICAAL